MARNPLASGCPNCGSASGEGARAFVPYDAEPNGAQQECDWADELPESLRAFVCTECSHVLGTVDVRDPEDLPDLDGDDNEFRVDEELR